MEALAEATGHSRATLYRRIGSRSKLIDRLAAEGHLDPESLERRDVKTRVLEAMRSETGVPVVLNTSLNGPGEPIAASEVDLLSFFARHPVNALVVEDVVITR